jgi:DNA ligase 1
MLYSGLVSLYESLEGTSKRLKKTYYIAELLKKTDPKELDRVLLLLQGKVFPSWDEKEIGVASKLMIKAISATAGVSDGKVEEEWKKAGDLGTVASSLISKRRQNSLFARELSVEKVFSNIQAIAAFGGKGTVDKKLSLISELLVSSTPAEAKYIVRTILEVMRVGVGSGSIRDAIVWAYFSDEIGLSYDKEGNLLDLSDEVREKYNMYLGEIQHGYDITNEFSVVVKDLKEKGIGAIKDIPLTVGKPISAMLFVKAKDIPDAFSIVGKPAAFEYKIDGFRLQVHKKGDDVKLFTRRLDNVTKQFPEIEKYARSRIRGDSFILDGEAVGFDPKTGRFMPFQSISQRIKRKHDIEEMARQFPVELMIFDIMEHDGKNLLDEPFERRRAVLESIVKEKDREILLV